MGQRKAREEDISKQGAKSMDYMQTDFERTSWHLIGHKSIDCQQEIWLQYVDLQFEKALQKQKNYLAKDTKHAGTTTTQDHRRTAKRNR